MQLVSVLEEGDDIIVGPLLTRLMGNRDPSGQKPHLGYLTFVPRIEVARGPIRCCSSQRSNAAIIVLGLLLRERG